MSATASPPHNTPAATHEVRNQVPPLVGHNTYVSNTPLVEGCRREGAAWAEQRLHAIGELAGSAQAREWGEQANRNPPVLRTHDRYGNRIDEVDFHPAWHELLEVAVGHELHALPWRNPREGAHVARAGLFMAWSVEAGHGCPISMTYSGVPALRAQPEIAAEWEPRMLSTTYDRRFIPASEKNGVLLGMAMTEKQGGSDVRANSTVARPLNGGGAGGEYEITGHKWFCSAPMCDAFLVLAQTNHEGHAAPSCFLLPRFTPDGRRNDFHLQRLKDKLGNRSNASSEVEFRGAWAQMVGEQGRGVPTIIEMVGHTRLDCVVGSAGGMRSGVEQATHHAAHRSAFGKLLTDQPLMRNVLADLCVESEAATVTALRLARSYDAASEDEHEALFKRLATAVSKYWICKRGPAHSAEALECLGGNGYVEESGMPRLYREMPLASIWEGSGNVICLDVLRALTRTPKSLEAFFGELGEAAGVEPRLDAYVAELRKLFSDGEEIESSARRIVERMALALQGSLLVRHGDPAVADAFCASRLGGDWGRAFGTLPPGVDFEAIIERHRPSI
ncbi:MAG TPA: acyl-CoA dehydrogenase family protein [Solirubrobacteraceae bacterium]|nr:acyl-CoA dehydrogenase family protein [Solirubrobacteraceae bacterium]